MGEVIKFPNLKKKRVDESYIEDWKEGLERLKKIKMEITNYYPELQELIDKEKNS